MLEVRCLSVGRLQTNAYLVFDEEFRRGIVIDPGDEAERIMDLISRCDVEVDAIYLTHGHFDHVLALRDLRRELRCKVYLHKADEGILASAPRDAKYFLGIEVPPPPKPDGWIADGQLIWIGSHLGKVLHTPGHTRGSVCYVFEEMIFTGDTLFAGSVGRTDLPGGSLKDLVSSLSKILNFPDEFMIYPGHGPSSTVGVERKLNAFVRNLMASGD